MISSNTDSAKARGRWIHLQLLAFLLLLGTAFSARAENCSDYPGGVLPEPMQDILLYGRLHVGAHEQRFDFFQAYSLAFIYSPQVDFSSQIGPVDAIRAYRPAAVGVAQQVTRPWQ